MRALSLPETSPQRSFAPSKTLPGSSEHGAFTKQRPWSDDQFKTVIAAAQSWTELAAALGLYPGSYDGWTRVKAHAVRLGLTSAE